MPTHRRHHRRSLVRRIAGATLAAAIPIGAHAAEAPDFASPPLSYLAVQGHSPAGASITPATWSARGLDAFGDHAIFGAYLAGAADGVAVVGGRPDVPATLSAASRTSRLLLVVLGGSASLPVANGAPRTLLPGAILVLESGKAPLTIGPRGLLAITVDLPAALPIGADAPPAPAGTAAWPKPADSLAKLTNPDLTIFHYFSMETGPDGLSHVTPAAWTQARPDPSSAGLVDFYRTAAKHLNLVSAKPSYRTPPHNVGAAAELDVVLRGSSTGLYENGRTQMFHAGDMLLIDDKGSKGRAVKIGANGYLALSVNLTR